MSVKPNNPTSQQTLRAMGESIKAHLDSHGAQLFKGGSHYLISIKDGTDASDAWAHQMRNSRGAGLDEDVRIVSRMMGGVLKKHQKELYPWTTFSFHPSQIDLGDDKAYSFLNLQAMNNISSTLWAMVRVHDTGDKKRPLELCCYVGRNIPSLDAVVEPQLRIPLMFNFKLKADGMEGPSALFCDNAYLSNTLQTTPSVVDFGELDDGATLNFEVKNVGDEEVSIIELVGRDFEDDICELDGLSIDGLSVGQKLQPGDSVTFSVTRDSDACDDLAKLSIGYLFGEADEEDEEPLPDEESLVSLQGEEERMLHTFLYQGQAYELLKRALLNPESIIEMTADPVDLSELVEGDFSLSYEEEEREESDLENETVSILLNEPDFAGGSVGTIAMHLKSTRPAEDFEAQLRAEDLDDPMLKLSSETLTLDGLSAIPVSLCEPFAKGRKRSTKAKDAQEDQQHTLDLIYLGHLVFYNNLQTPDQGKLRNFILNCVALASLIRAVPVVEVAPPEEEEDFAV